MKRDIILTALFFLCVSFCGKANGQISYWDGVSSSTDWYSAGKSTYYIRTAEDLCGLSQLLIPGKYIDFSAKEVILLSDIDLCNYEWKPIGGVEVGNYSYTFKGIFNGNGKKISGLQISNLNEGGIKTIGLFGVLFESGTVVKNLEVEGSISLTNNDANVNVGGITGLNYATIYNCKSNMNIQVTSNNATSGTYIGSIVGANNGIIRNCQTKGEIQLSQNGISTCRLGGISGTAPNDASDITCCSSSTNITVIGGKTVNVGGISSIIRGKNVNNLYTGNIDINDCYVAYAGGIVSFMSSAENCIMLGSFSGYGDFYYKGAIRATKEADLPVKNCYYKESLPNSSTSGISISDQEIKSGNILPEFDVSIWNFTYGRYPELLFSFEEEIDIPVVKDIYLNKERTTLEIGKTEILQVSFTPVGTSDQITWKSSDRNIVTVNSNGRIKALKEGIATITAEISNGKTATCVVKVISAYPEEEITVSKWDGKSYSTSWYKPDESIYYIRTAADLYGLTKLLIPGMYINFTGKELVLSNNIDLCGYDWPSIGTITDENVYYSFKGIFNGNGKTISGLNITKVYGDGILRSTGLFSALFLYGTVIKNLTVKGEIFVSNHEAYASIGGITGINFGTIYNCITDISVRVDASKSIDYCTTYIGGIVGNNNGIVRHSQFSGSIVVNQNDNRCKSFVGGIAGTRDGGMYVGTSTPLNGSFIEACKSSAELIVSGGKECKIGGISAIIDGVNKNNLFTGNIDVNDCGHTFAGGIVAYRSKAENCLMLGSFSGSGDFYYKGAIRATEEKDMPIENCYYREGLFDSSTGNSVSDQNLMTGDVLPGFERSIWDFSYGKYPDLLFSFEDIITIPTSNEQIQIHNLSINGCKNGIVINTSVPSEAYIYTITGRLVDKYLLSGGINNISMEKGIYIVKIKMSVQKVIVL